MDFKKVFTRVIGHGRGKNPDEGARSDVLPAQQIIVPDRQSTWSMVPAIQGEIFGPSAGDTSLGPQTVDEFVGHERVKERLLLACECARREGRALPPMLLTGPTGSGKSTLANLVARAWRARPTLFRAASDYKPENLKRDMQSIAGKAVHYPVLMLDELHAASSGLRATLLVLLDQINGQAPGGEAIRTARLTVIGLTNKSVEEALRRRFPMQLDLGLSTEADLIKIVELFANRSGTQCEPQAARLLARVSYTPGRARVLFFESRNRAVVADRPIDQNLVLETLNAMGVDTDTGLDEKQLAALRCLCQVGRASARSVSIALGIDEQAYENAEELLVRLGLVTITSRGRSPTGAGLSLIRRMGG